MPCLRKQAVARVVSNVTTIIKYFFFFFYLFSLFVVKLFIWLFRNDDEYEEEEEEEEEEDEEEDERVEEVEEEDYKYDLHVEKEHLVADVVNGGDDIVFLPKNMHGIRSDQNHHGHTDSSNSCESCIVEDILDEDDFDSKLASYVECYPSSEFEHVKPVDNMEQKPNPKHDSESIEEDIRSAFKSPVHINVKEDFLNRNHGINHAENDERKMGGVQEEANFTKDEKFLVFEPPKSETKKMIQESKNKVKDETKFEETYTIGSTSKSSSEWRSSIRDSEDPFSSSSRRSCPKWESYTVYQKYDEEMMYLDRISAQKLHETESLKSIKVEPRSISQRIVHKLGTTKKQRTTERMYQTKYHELEAAYVAQVCLAWEALNWNYANFQRKRAASTDQDPGCPAHIAQQFQQFHVLLQRYIENEPYERGRRPEIYARMRTFAPKLLQVPEYHDYEEEEENEEGGRLRITSESFLTILEDVIRTFMQFLKADRESHCQVLTALFRGRPRGTIDPNLVQIVRKHNKKMTAKLKDLQYRGNCLKRRKLPKDEEMKVLMGLIDLKLVSRVLRMTDITKEQLRWCEQKMSRIKVVDGKLHRDSTPLFFPDIEAHPNPNLDPYPDVPQRPNMENKVSHPLNQPFSIKEKALEGQKVTLLE